jgi:acyl dehydratase
MVVPLDQSVKERHYPPSAPYEVGREKIREFAEAIKDSGALSRDRDAAKAAGYPDVIAPPTFAFTLCMHALQAVMDDSELGVDYSRVVHGQQEFTHHRPIHAGDELVVVTHIDDVQHRAGNDFLTVRAEIAASDGEPVCTAMSMLVVRATADGESA